MKVELVVTTMEDYFDHFEKQIDWNGGNSNKIPVEQAEDLQKILSCEVSMFLLRRAYGVDGSIVDNMTDIRRFFIDSYELKHKENYKHFNEELL